MKKPKKYYRVIQLGMIPYDILVCQGMPSIEVKGYLKRKYKLEFPEPTTPEEKDAWEETATRRGRTYQLGGNQIVLWLKDPPITPVSISTLAHEALHAINYVAMTAGIDFGHDSEEFFAYGLEYIVEEVLKDFKN